MGVNKSTTPNMTEKDAKIKDAVLEKLKPTQGKMGLDSSSFDYKFRKKLGAGEDMEFRAYLNELQEDKHIRLDLTQGGYFIIVTPEGLKFYNDGGYTAQWKAEKARQKKEDNKESKISAIQIITLGIAGAALLWQIIESILPLFQKYYSFLIL
jgi:hypothetical protein